MLMTLSEQLITIALIALATMLTRFLPFWIFPSDRPTPKFIRYLRQVLPAAAISLLVIYCLKNVSLLEGSHGIPEFICIGVTALLHIWKRKMLISIASGTILYMLLIQFVF